MKILIGALLLAAGLVGIPVTLVSVPAAAVSEPDARRSVLEPETAREHCGVRMECLQ